MNTNFPASLFVLLLMTSCTTSKSELKPEETRKTETLQSFDVSSHLTRCWDPWAEVIDEWRANGGGVRESIKDTRAQISEDFQSRFAAIVRRAWASQPLPDRRHQVQVGSWPIDKNTSRRIYGKFSFIESDGIPEGCRSLAWLDSYFWDEVRDLSGRMKEPRKLLETPSSIEWTSPFVQQWLKYWIFVRLE